MIFWEQISSKLTLAVMFKDSLFPENNANGPLYVKPLNNEIPWRKTPWRHSTGHFLFLDLVVPQDGLTFIAGGDFYRETSFTITQSDLNSTPAFKNNFYLEPKSNYPFPAGLTVLRGKVRETTGHGPVAKVLIEVEDPRATVDYSEAEGGFYLLFPSIDQDDTIQPAQEVEISVNITRDGFFEQRGVNFSVKKGSVTFVNVELTKIS
ncbi:MAG TPA: hypothetical protein VHY08_29590 [Bacillota bacterium]|nr:hypothetical protein [Bacillota bacterium]